MRRAVSLSGGAINPPRRHDDSDLRADAHQRAKLRGERDPDGRHVVVCTSTDSTAVRCSTIGAYVSPESAEA